MDQDILIVISNSLEESASRIGINFDKLFKIFINWIDLIGYKTFEHVLSIITNNNDIHEEITYQKYGIKYIIPLSKDIHFNINNNDLIIYLKNKYSYEENYDGKNISTYKHVVNFYGNKKIIISGISNIVIYIDI